ncbi:hypothetical protein RW115_10610 [Macrococcus capreoli]
MFNIMKTVTLFLTLLCSLLISTHHAFAASHVVLAVGPNNAIVSSLFLCSGACIMMVIDKFKKDKSSEDHE